MARVRRAVWCARKPVEFIVKCLKCYDMRISTLGCRAQIIFGEWIFLLRVQASALKGPIGSGSTSIGGAYLTGQVSRWVKKVATSN